MATAVIEKQKNAAAETNDNILAALGMDTMALTELVNATSALEVARAWAAGIVEFGHRDYCVTGPVGKDNSTLVVEDGFSWTGEKKPYHKNYRNIADEKLPETRKHTKYVLTPGHGPNDAPFLKPTPIDREEALKLIALQVRLTDKGLTAIGVA